MNYSAANPPSTPNKYTSQASTNAQVLVSSPCTLTFLALGSLGAASGACVKLYDKASAVPVLASDVPVQVYVVPGIATGSGSNLAPPGGLTFSKGLAIAITGGLADTDTTAIAAAQVVLSYATRQ